MSKKVLSVMLAIMLVLSTFAVTAFAAGSAFEVEDKDEGVILSTQVWSLSKEATKVSDSVYKVDVALTTDYVTGAISFRVDAANGATLTDVEINEEVITYAYDLAFNANGLVAIVPQPATESEDGIEVDGVIATLTYTLAGEGDTLTLVNDAKTETNPGGDLIAVRLSDNNLSTGTMIYGQRVVDANGDDIEADAVIASVNIGAVAAPADLALSSAGATAGVIIDTNKTFGGAYAGVVYGVTATTYKAKTNITNNVEATNNGSLVVKASDGKSNASGNYGTGSTIEVFNADGTTTGKIYVFVAFGDVDGNGLINGQDAQKVIDSVAGDATVAPNNSVKRMAANCQIVKAEAMMHNLNGQDAQKIIDHVAGTKVDQVALAEKMASLTGNYYK